MEILGLRLARLPIAVLEYEPTLLPLSGGWGAGGGGVRKDRTRESGGNRALD